VSRAGTPQRVELREEVARIAARAACGSYYPAVGGRNDIATTKADFALADAAIALIVKRCAQVAQDEAGAYTEDGEGDYWIALRIRDRLMSLAPQPEART
jgi:hypothetical protein